jgi:hypothetical protein
MPRKQRFKPSRKPKPAPQTEATAIGQEVRSTSSIGGTYSEQIESGGAGHKGEDDSSLKPETDSR